MTNAQLLLYSQWSAIITIVFAIFTIITFIFKWGFRFRMVGVTSFMGVLTGGIFALSLGLFTRVEIPGAVRYSLVYDTGGNQTVIAVPPTITPNELEATMRQAAGDLFSFGRGGSGTGKLTIRVRTILHPQEGVSEPLYLGEVKRSLAQREDENLEINLFKSSLKRLSSIQS